MQGVDLATVEDTDLTIDAPPGGADWHLYVKSGNLELLDEQSGTLYFSQPVSTINSLTLVGSSGASNQLFIDFSKGGAFQLAGGINFTSTADAVNSISFAGGTSATTVSFAANSVTFSGVQVTWPQGSQLTISTNRLADPVSYVQSLYSATLGRAPDASGYSYWVSQMQSGATQQQLADAFWDCPEHRNIEVESYYGRYLQRGSSAAERAGWVNALENGIGETAVMLGFTTSAEYHQDHPTENDYITALYNDVLQRQPDTAGLQAWLAASAQGSSDAFIALSFLNSTEARDDLIDWCYQNYLGRTGSTAEVAGWETQMQNGLSRAALQEAFLASDEFFSRS